MCQSFYAGGCVEFSQKFILSNAIQVVLKIYIFKAFNFCI